MADEDKRWWLENAEARNAEAPDSYFIPPREKRESLQVGDLVAGSLVWETRAENKSATKRSSVGQTSDG
jgi:hypothetical protein